MKKIKTIADLKTVEVVAKKLTAFLYDEEFSVQVALEYVLCDNFKVYDFCDKLEELDGVKCSYTKEMCDNPMCHGVMHSGYINCESPYGCIHMNISCGEPVWKSLKLAKI